VSGPRITVGVATCGRPEGLARCLAGLLEQTEPAFEIVVVDQAPGAAARAGSAQAGARYVEQERRGLSASRNRALVECTGDVLAVTDDDCVPDPGWIAGLAAALTREPAPAAVSGPILPPRGEQPPGTYAISLRESEAPVDHAGGVPPWQAGSGANFAAAAERLRALGGWDERLGTGSPGRAAEDADLLYRLLRDGGTVRYEPTAVVRHDWQPRARRLATRWSYAYGVGAMAGLWLARGEPEGARWLAGYARMHVRPLLGALRRRDRDGLRQHARAIGGLVPGALYGIRAGRSGA
jgi:glycosyltransferase involved in cell wall biosynthesis